jgi:hypothetical protein
MQRIVSVEAQNRTFYGKGMCLLREEEEELATSIVGTIAIGVTITAALRYSGLPPEWSNRCPLGGDRFAMRKRRLFDPVQDGNCNLTIREAPCRRRTEHRRSM